MRNEIGAMEWHSNESKKIVDELVRLVDEKVIEQFANGLVRNPRRIGPGLIHSLFDLQGRPTC